MLCNLWTYNEKESIPLWKMYAGKEMHSVRISMEKDMFKKVRVFSGNYKGVNILAHKDGGLTELLACFLLIVRIHKT